MASQDVISAKLLHKALDYDPETGSLTWKERPPDLFTKGRFRPAHQALVWNAQFAGKPALDCLHIEGYKHGHLFGKSVKSHRAIWALMTGRWPIAFIDHINGDRADNRWSNLREVDNSTNLRNAKMRTDNRSGHNGVGWHKASGKWRARITVNNRQVHLGSFDAFDDAVAARRAAEVGKGFTERHGH